MNIFRFSFVHKSKTTRRSRSQPTSLESEGLFNAKKQSSDKKFYRFLPQKRIPTFRFFSDFYNFFEKIEICQITIVCISKFIACIDSKPLSIDSEGFFDAKMKLSDYKFYRFLP